MSVNFYDRAIQSTFIITEFYAFSHAKHALKLKFKANLKMAY